jgi:hypothetical protein
LCAKYLIPITISGLNVLQSEHKHKVTTVQPERNVKSFPHPALRDSLPEGEGFFTLLPLGEGPGMREEVDFVAALNRHNIRT